MKNHDPAEQSRNQQAAADPKPDKAGGDKAPNVADAVAALIEAMQHLNNDNRGGQAQAEIDRAKAAMKGV